MQKILIVEDDIDIQDILKNHLIDAGYEVAVASDGVAGIAMFGDTIDLVLLDIMLPKIDGYGVCEVIRNKSCFLCHLYRHRNRDFHKTMFPLCCPYLPMPHRLQLSELPAHHLWYVHNQFYIHFQN